MTSSPASVPGAFDLPFDEAIAFFRQKIDMPSKDYRALYEGMHARGFVVAGATNAQLLADFRAAIDKALADGTTLDTFRKDFAQIVAANGWTDYTGADSAKGRAWRTGVIFDTNLRTARAAGQWAQIQRTKKTHKWLRYVAVQDDRTRDEHRQWDGLVLDADDAFWKTHYPPNGWNCRCTVEALDQVDLDEEGIEPDKAPPVEMETRTVKTADGDMQVQVPKGIDTGFGTNVGEAAGLALSPERLAMERAGLFEEIASPLQPPPERVPPLAAEPARAKQAAEVSPGDGDAMRAVLRDAIGGDEKTFVDPAGGRVRINGAIVDHLLADEKRLAAHRERFFPFIPELIEDPAEIWTTFARSTETGAVRLRRRYVKRLQLGKERSVAFVAEQDNGIWSGFNFLMSDREIGNVRKGTRIYERGRPKKPGAES
jgi:SPP1 gp7 family putative phage head morphogenesis protein